MIALLEGHGQSLSSEPNGVVVLRYHGVGRSSG